MTGGYTSNMKKKLTSIVLILSTTFTALAVTVGTFAWFVGKQFTNEKFKDIDGAAMSAYFAYGDGSAGDPYGIKTPRQLYNLAWLQYNGTFNKDKNNDGTIDKQFYFVLDPSLQSTGLDMTGWVLPPIGTEDYPFLGNFEGNGVSINNLTVSNKTDLEKPRGIDYSEQPEIVGFFGVVGEIDANLTYDSSINTLNDFTLNNVTVESKTSETLIGLAAGYVNADISGIRINGDATLDVNGQASTAKSEITSKLSDYALVGHTTKIGSSGSYSQDLSEYFANYKDSGGGSSGGDQWGGSINFQDFNRRIRAQLRSASAQTIQQNPTSSPSSTSTSYQRMRVYSNDYLSASIYYGSNIMSNIVNKDPDSNRVIYNYLDEGSYTRSSYVQVNNIPGTVQPLTTVANDYFTPSGDNTGYIVSGVANHNYSGNNYGMTIRTASYESRFIANALGDQTYDSRYINSGTDNGKTTGNKITFPSYNRTKAEILTNSSATYGANNYVYIKDEMDGYNQNHSVNYSYTKSNSTTPTALGLQKYNDSRRTLDSVLNGHSFVHGLHFIGSSVTYNSYVTRNNIKLLGNTKNSYKLPVNAIDFNLPEKGIINFFAGSYYSRGTPTSSSVYASDSDNFFSLYHIVRSGDDLVSNSVKKISVIYENTDTSLTNKYVYQYSDNSYSSGTRGTRLFDAAYLDHCPVPNALYYFEIPVDAGEYALGAANSSSSSYGGYLMYLDIGASSGEDKDMVNAYSITTKTTGNTFPIGVDFAPVTVSGNGGESIGIFIASGKQGVVTFTVVTSSPAKITVDDDDEITNYSFHGTKYSDSSPPATNFIVDGDSPGPMDSPPVGGTRVLLITLNSLNDAKDCEVRITDSLDENDAIVSSTYEIKYANDSEFATTTLTVVNGLSTEINLTDLRALTIVTTLTRTGTVYTEFTTEYDTVNCSYSDKKIDVDVTLNGAQATVGPVTTNYSFFVGGVQKYASDVLS